MRRFAGLDGNQESVAADVRRLYLPVFGATTRN
jgi:hypothetical protein